MNPLEEYPHLFATGKFRVKYNYPEWGTEYNSDGVFDFTPYRLGTLHRRFVNPDNCTLIARRIEDMTDEECREIIPITGIPYDVETFKEDYSEIPIENLTVAEFNAFCDIGVINWSQLFEDGMVIRREES